MQLQAKQDSSKTGARMLGRTEGQTGWTDGRLAGQKSARANREGEWADDSNMEKRSEGWIEEKPDGRTGGRKSGRRDGWADGRAEGWIFRNICMKKHNNTISLLI